jgi:hypothetical protein
MEVEFYDMRRVWVCAFPPFAKNAKDGAPSMSWWRKGRAAALSLGLCFPTLRKVREGWGTRAVLAVELDVKSQQVVHSI